VIALVVHGHFYQPPRENPWSDEISDEPSAAPYPNWNARIHAECYRPNAFARIHGRGDRIRAVVNNYARISFNVGPTLARWIERHDPWTHRRMRDGDEDQRRRLGRGGALAQVWGHPIAPLLSPADRRTQILWGLADFARRFGRPAAGLWLPETAVDPATLESLIEADVAFTILAPEQIAAVRPEGKAAFSAVTRDTLDTGRAYKWFHRDGSGRSIALGVFDGPLSRDLAFGGAARDADAFLSAVEDAAARSTETGPRLVMVASDGELYGHHKKFADLTLAYATAVEAEARDIDVTNLAAFLAASPPTWEARLAEGPSGEGTAWSCAHGLGRWQRHCGCAMRPPAESGWSQAWRAPLRSALDLLRDRTAELFEDAGGDLFLDPWGARDAYGSVLDDPPSARLVALRDLARAPLQGSTGDRALGLLETMRAALAMYASCGWFFDDIGGLESALVLRQAAYVLDGWRALGARPPTEDVLDVLAVAESNLPPHETGADVLRRVSRDRLTPVQVAAAAALSSLFPAAAQAPADQPGHDVHLEPAGGGGPRPGARAWARVTHRRTGLATLVRVEARADPLPRARAAGARVALGDLPLDLRRPVALRWLGALAGLTRVDRRAAEHALEAAALARVGGDAAAAPPGDPVVSEALEDVTLGLLASLRPGLARAADVDLGARLIRAIGRGPHEAERVAQEWVGERLEMETAMGREPAHALRILAEAVGFGLD
jgi:hypothetical protein